MNKEMQKLLKAINDKKNEVKSLVNDGKLDKAKAAKEELKELQEKFDLLFDLDEEEHEEIEDKVATGTAKTIGAKADKKNLVKAFVNIVKCGFLKREPDEGDVKVYKDALSTDTTKGDDDEMGIGVTDSGGHQNRHHRVKTFRGQSGAVCQCGGSDHKERFSKH